MIARSWVLGLVGVALLGASALALAQATDDRMGGAPTGTYVAGGTDVALADGGTNKSVTASAGGIVWVDSDSFEVLAGTATANALLVSGNAATPAWVTGITATGTTITGATTLNLDSTTVNLSVGGSAQFQCFSGTCRTQNGAAISSSGGRLTTGAGKLDWATVPTIVVGASATTFALTSNYNIVDCNAGGNNIDTITGVQASSGMSAWFKFIDASCHLNDADDGGSNTLDLNEVDAAGDNDIDTADDMILHLVHDGSAWEQVGPVSQN